MNRATLPAFDRDPGIAALRGDQSAAWREQVAIARLFGQLEGRPTALADLTTLSAGLLTARSELGRRDHVTLLPNRLRFVADMAAAQPAGGSALVLVTLADAKHYNELLRALGHAFADDFVRAGMARVQALIPETAMLYHVSVLSFAFVCGGDLDDAAALAVAMAADFRLPVLCQGLSITTSFGVGVVGLTEAIEPAALLRHALTAAQDSRGRPAGWARYDRASDAAHQRAFQMAHDLETALRSPGQLTLLYQPRVALASGGCAGAEALLRWRHPRLGPISPAEFIPLAEATSTIGPLTDWVLNTGVAQAALWQRQNLQIKLSINVSAQNLKETDFADRVAAALHVSGLDPRALECEVTETVMAAADVATNASLAALNAMGVDIAIDDFGSGYSGMSYLAKLPAQVLKIDRSFVAQMLTTERHQHLVRSIVNLAHDLDYRVVAEGIEDQPSYDMLAGWGCDEGQGFFMSRPIAAEALAGWIGQSRVVAG